MVLDSGSPFQNWIKSHGGREPGEVLAGQLLVAIRELPVGRTLVIGRGAHRYKQLDNDVPFRVEVPGVRVSRIHVRIERISADQYAVSDCHSREGTFVVCSGEDFKRIEPDSSVVVQSGEEIRIGDRVRLVLP